MQSGFDPPRSSPLASQRITVDGGAGVVHIED
jgi:hypothetical protein